MKDIKNMEGNGNRIVYNKDRVLKQYGHVEIMSDERWPKNTSLVAKGKRGTAQKWKTYLRTALEEKHLIGRLGRSKAVETKDI